MRAPDRVGAPVTRGASHRTGQVLFTSGSSGPRVVTPAVGRYSTSTYPSASVSCTGATSALAVAIQVSRSDIRPSAPKCALLRPRCTAAL